MKRRTSSKLQPKEAEWWITRAREHAQTGRDSRKARTHRRLRGGGRPGRWRPRAPRGAPAREARTRAAAPSARRGCEKGASGRTPQKRGLADARSQGRHTRCGAPQAQTQRTQGAPHARTRCGEAQPRAAAQHSHSERTGSCLARRSARPPPRPARAPTCRAKRLCHGRPAVHKEADRRERLGRPASGGAVR